jgi:GINS complex protein
VAIQAGRVVTIRDNPDLEMERIVYERDMQRTKWLIKAYHRARVRKIEQHVQHYLHVEDYTKRLSSAELEYAKDYFTAIGRCESCSHRMIAVWCAVPP